LTLPLRSVRHALTLVALVVLASGHNGLAAARATEPSIEVRPTTVRPGDVLLVVVNGAQTPPRGTALGRPLRFYALGDHHEALVAVPLEQEPGSIAVQVEADGSGLSAAVELQPGDFPERELTVDQRYVAPPPEVKARIAADRRAFARAYRTRFGPRVFTVGFARPRDAEVTARFGDLRMLNGKKKTVHYGLDLDGQVGDPVTAANDGTVILVRDCYTSGNTVLLSHGGGVITGYFHLSAFKVKQGAKVKRGELLGLVGKTGRVTGPHLHFLARVGALYVNPEALLALPFP
jgi:murein DD-endopeptidase MepM/ murein hydrolase activator NlpD